MEPTSANWRMADRLAGGRLAAIIDALLGDGASYRDVCAHLNEHYGIEVSHQTVVNWLAQLGQDEAAS